MTEGASLRLREVNQEWSESQVLQQFVTSLPIGYGGAINLVGSGVGVDVTRVDVSHVRAKYAQLPTRTCSSYQNVKIRVRLSLVERSTLNRARATVVGAKDTNRVSIPRSCVSLRALDADGLDHVGKGA